MGVTKNLHEALRLFKLGAEGGDPVGMNNHGSMLHLGMATELDVKTGFEWMLKAAMWAAKAKEAEAN